MMGLPLLPVALFQWQWMMVSAEYAPTMCYN